MVVSHYPALATSTKGRCESDGNPLWSKFFTPEGDAFLRRTSTPMTKHILWKCVPLTWIFLATSVITIHAQSPADGPDEQLYGFTPTEGQGLIKGELLTVSASIMLIPSQSEPIEFTNTITIKNHRYVFKTLLSRRTPTSEVSGSEVIIVPTHVPGPKNISIRLQLTGTGQLSNTEYAFDDVTRIYQVRCNAKELWIVRIIHHVFGCCSN